MIKKNSLFEAFLFSLLFTAIFLGSYLVNINKPLDYPFVDPPHTSMTIKHYLDIVITGNYKDILNMPIFYGIKDSLLLSEPFAFHAIVALPIYLLNRNIIFTFNFLAFFCVGMSFFSMYLFTHYLTKNRLPAILASVIFAFNPFVMSHFPDQMAYYSLGWLPLIFLFVEKSLDEPSRKNVFLVFFFLLCQMITSLTYLAFLSVILPVYALIRIWQKKTPLIKLANRGAVCGIILLLVATIGFFRLYSRFYASEPSGRDLTLTSFYSGWVSDYLFSPSSNFLYGGLRNKLLTIAPNLILDASELAEHNLFWGLIPALLLLASFKFLRRSTFSDIWKAGLVVLVLSIILSFGPYIHLSYTLNFPSLYLLVYTLNPVFHLLRVASRFAVFNYLVLGMIAAYVATSVMEKWRGKLGKIIVILLIAGTITEYWTKPLPFFTIDEETKSFYQQVDQKNDVKVLLELPMGGVADTRYMYWAITLHHKKLINGYSGVIPVIYQKRVEYLSVNFPDRIKLKQIKGWGVDAIILHKDEFRNLADFEMLRKSLKALGVKEIFATDNLVFFDLVNLSLHND